MRRYELALVGSPHLSEADHDARVTNIEQLIAEKGGVVHKVDRWGRRKLAYPIKKNTEASYTFLLWDGGPELETELMRRLRISDDYLRFMNIRSDEARLPSEEEREALLQQRAELLRREAERAAAREAGEEESEESDSEESESGDDETRERRRSRDDDDDDERRPRSRSRDDDDDDDDEEER